MSEVANIYDNGPISLIARIKDNLSIYSQKKWFHYNILFAEPWPRSSQQIVEMVAAAGATSIAGNGAIAKRVVAFLQVTENEMLHLRWKPIDDVEGVLWEQGGTGRFVSWNTQARVTLATPLWDPYLATTTFFILGNLRDMNLEVQNPHPVPVLQARFAFFGYRYVLEPIVPNLDAILAQTTDTRARALKKEEILKKLEQGDKATVAEIIGPTTWLPAEGR